MRSVQEIQGRIDEIDEIFTNSGKVGFPMVNATFGRPPWCTVSRRRNARIAKMTEVVVVELIAQRDELKEELEKRKQ